MGKVLILIGVSVLFCGFGFLSADFLSLRGFDLFIAGWTLACVNQFMLNEIVYMKNDN